MRVLKKVWTEGGVTLALFYGCGDSDFCQSIQANNYMTSSNGPLPHAPQTLILPNTTDFVSFPTINNS